MNLVNLELGKWVYLIIYLFFPILTIIYLIKAFGLELREDSLETARKHIEQANYWADVALQAAQSPLKSKSLSSLEHTIQHNMNQAFKFLVKVESRSDELKSLKKELRHVEQKLVRVQILITATSPISASPSPQ